MASCNMATRRATITQRPSHHAWKGGLGDGSRPRTSWYVPGERSTRPARLSRRHPRGPREASATGCVTWRQRASSTVGRRSVCTGRAATTNKAETTDEARVIGGHDFLLLLCKGSSRRQAGGLLDCKMLARQDDARPDGHTALCYKGGFRRRANGQMRNR